MTVTVTFYISNIYLLKILQKNFLQIENIFINFLLNLLLKYIKSKFFLQLSK